MQTERAVKCHTLLKSDLHNSMAHDTVNNQTIITLNSSRTTHFDPRPAVAKFLTKKKKKTIRLSEAELYMNRNFIKHVLKLIII